MKSSVTPSEITTYNRNSDITVQRNIENPLYLCFSPISYTE